MPLLDPPGDAHETLAPNAVRIVDAALALFAERGCHATPVPAIAKRAGVGAGTIYRHFADKDALVNAVYRRSKQRLASAIDAAIGEAVDAPARTEHGSATDEARRSSVRLAASPLTRRAPADASLAERRFLALWSALADFARERPAEFHFLELHDHGSYLDAASRQLETRVLMPLWLDLVDAQRRRFVRPDLRPEVAIAMVWGALVGLFKAQRQGFLTLDEASVAAAGRACWDGIRARAPAPDAAATAPD